jgi:hypothetical protein
MRMDLEGLVAWTEDFCVTSHTKPISSIVSYQVVLMLVANALQDDLTAKKICTSARIFDYFVSAFADISLCLFFICHLCHIIFYYNIHIVLYLPSQQEIELTVRRSIEVDSDLVFMISDILSYATSCDLVPDLRSWSIGKMLDMWAKVDLHSNLNEYTCLQILIMEIYKRCYLKQADLFSRKSNG